MRIERDREADLLYIELREGEADETLDLAEGVHMDVDAEGHVLGLEFLSLQAFERYLERHDGAVEVPDRVAKMVIPQEELHSVLTPLEVEVLQLLAQGLTNREIAAELDVSNGTVRTILSRMYKKLGVRNRDEAKTLLATGS